MKYLLIIIMLLIPWSLSAEENCGTDFQGVPRCEKYVGDRPDIGAFEYVPNITESEPPHNVENVRLED